MESIIKGINTLQGPLVAHWQYLRIFYAGNFVETTVTLCFKRNDKGTPIQIHAPVFGHLRLFDRGFPNVRVPIIKGGNTKQLKRGKPNQL